jgi:putative transposon-encoded protein
MASTMADYDVQLIHDVQISYFYTTTPFNGSGKIIVALFSI